MLTPEEKQKQREAYLEQMREFTFRVYQLRMARERLIIEMGEYIRAEVDTDLLQNLYWNHDVDVQLLSKSSGLGNTGLSRLIRKLQSYRAYHPCRDCGELVHRDVHSRAERDAFERNRNVQCDTCQSAREAELQERRRQHAASEVKRQMRVEELRAMPYAEYLQSPEWQETRGRALRRANYQCELCATKKRLHVHHKTYINRGEEQPGDLVVLCSKCHAKFHGKVVAE